LRSVNHCGFAQIVQTPTPWVRHESGIELVQRRGEWIDLVDPNAVAAGMFCRVQRRQAAIRRLAAAMAKARRPRC